MGAASSTVWMVHARTGIQGLKGTLTLEGEVLTFRPESTKAATSRFQVPEVTRARRVRGSPILEIYLRSATAPPVVGFYFVKPPSLQEAATLTFLKRRTAKKKALNKLRGANAFKKEEVERWVASIEKAKSRVEE